jgi:hypothetical protein
MAYKVRADGVIGRVAIYEATDDNPWGSPLSYLSRVVFHSGLAYPAQVATLTGSVTFPSDGAGSVREVVNTTYTLAAHGLPGIPIVEGKWIGIGAGGADVPMVGSVPIYSGSYFVLRTATLGADATNVVIHEQHARYVSAVGANYPSLTRSYEIQILGWLL